MDSMRPDALQSHATCPSAALAIDWKASEFNVLTPSCFDGWTIAYNSHSGALLYLSNMDADQLRTAVRRLTSRGGTPATAAESAAVAAGFVVRADRDERAEVRQRYWEGRETPRGLSLTLAPTVNCNFGCTYCYQQHTNRRMDEDDIQNLMSFVSRNLPLNSALYVTWFGGEPLTALPVLRRLIPELAAVAAARGASFRQSMITNAYLLTPDVAQWLASFGNFDYLQVTLDGPEAAHDLRRPLAGGRGTFGRILRNVREAVRFLPVTIRVNVDKRNVHGLDLLLDQLVRAGLRSKVGVYLGHTAPYTDVCADVAEHGFTREEYAAVEARFRFVLLQRGWLGRIGAPKPRFGGLCIADNPSGYVIAPDSLVFKCWNEVAEDAGKASALLASDGSLSPLTEAGQKWQSFDPFVHVPCRTCRVQPLCRGGCPWEASKNPAGEPGHCTTLRYNLEDMLRLAHLEHSLRQTLGPEGASDSGDHYSGGLSRS